MSYTYSQDAGEESSAASFSDITLFAPLKSNLTAAACSCNGSGTACCHDSQSGTTCEPSMGDLGGDGLMSSAVGFPARTSALLEEGQESKASEADCGEKWLESFATFNRDSSSWKIRQLWLFADLDESLATWPKWGWMRGGECWDAGTPVGCTNAIESGYLHLPTIGKNETKGSSRKRFRNSPDFRGAKMSEGLRTSLNDPIYTHPRFAELMMGWPLNWTRLQPLETDKFQSWLRSHGESFQTESRNDT
jgi:hypothetical protein